jgi:hypothetical protein
MIFLVARTIVPLGNFALGYAELMLKDVQPKTFARLARVGNGADAKVVQSNHPAWVLGHLSIYQQRVMQLINKPAGATALPPRFEELFKNGSPCLDDPDGKIYPSMDEITGFYFKACKEAHLALSHTTDEVLMLPNPNEQSRARFATVGIACSFLTCGHHMVHLGQVSAWRRMMGLPSAM